MPSNPPQSAASETAAPLSGTGKRKTAKKSAPAGAARSAPKRKAPLSQGPTEIVFKDLPPHGREALPPFIWIDHPQENERLFHSAYVVRLGVGGAEAVEISVDGSAWQPCRLTSGYWWYDWSDIPRGKHTLTAHMRTAGGQWYRTPPRTIVF